VKQEPLRLFADAHVFDGAYQGSRTFLLGLYSALAKNEDVQLYLGARDVAGLKNEFGSVATSIRFVAYRSKGRMRRLLWELPRLLRAHRIDYAHFQYVAPLHTVCPYIVTTHDVLFEEQGSLFPAHYRALRKRVFRYAARKASILTTVSAHAAAAICRHYQIAPGRLSIVPNAPDNRVASDALGARARLRLKYGFDKYLLNVSRLEPRKNQAMLVEAFKRHRLAEKGYRLVFIGCRSLPVPELESALSRLDATERKSVFLLDGIDRAELQDWYEGAALFVYPSLGEGFGIPPLEAAMAGVPVLCSNRTALADFDFFGDDHLDPGNREVFIERIGELLQHPPTQEVLDQRAEAVASRYCWERSAQLFFELIRQHRAKQVSR
jgi:glycosyltransferase involved in cell wall biosynthesis